MKKNFKSLFQMGWGDLGCYGNPVSETPHLDSMAAEGMRFTDFYTGSAICSPCKLVRLTGFLNQLTIYPDTRISLDTILTVLAMKIFCCICVLTLPYSFVKFYFNKYGQNYYYRNIYRNYIFILLVFPHVANFRYVGSCNS